MRCVLARFLCTLTLLAAPCLTSRAQTILPPHVAEAPGRLTTGIRIIGTETGIGLAAVAVALTIEAVHGEHTFEAYMLTPLVGAPLGSYAAGRLTGTPGTLSGALRGSLIGGAPGLVVLVGSMAAGNPRIEVFGLSAAAYAAGSTIGAVVGYNGARIDLGLARLPGGTAPTLQVRF